jgi:peptidase YpeB-like protein
VRVTMLACAFLLFAASTAAAEKRPLTEQEQTRLAEAVKAEGCSGGKMKVEDGNFEVEDATCADGKKWELKFDGAFKLIKKEIDD